MDAFVDEDKRPRTSTAQSRELGTELQRARKNARLRGTKVVEELEWSTAKLSKLEKGGRGTVVSDISTLLGKYGCDKSTRDRLLRLVEEPSTGYFLRLHDHGTGDDLLNLAIHERAAATLTTYEPMVIPALLQTEAYMRALLATDDVESTEALVGTRRERQNALSGIGPPDAVFFVHEIALQLIVGDTATMHDQLMHLKFVSRWARRCIRVIPMSAGLHSALQHASTVLTFARGWKSLAYGHTDVATVFLEHTGGVGVHEAKHTALSALALDAGKSRELITRWVDAYDTAQVGNFRVSP